MKDATARVTATEDELEAKKKGLMTEVNADGNKILDDQKVLNQAEMKEVEATLKTELAAAMAELAKDKDAAMKVLEKQADELSEVIVKKVLEGTDTVIPSGAMNSAA